MAEQAKIVQIEVDGKLLTFAPAPAAEQLIARSTMSVSRHSVKVKFWSRGMQILDFIRRVASRQ